MGQQDFPEKQQFKNAAQHVIGAVVLDPQNQPKGVPLQPGETILLSDTEQRLTANAPRDPANNPLANGQLVPSTDERPTRSERPLEAPPEPPPAAPTEPPAPAQTGDVVAGTQAHSNVNQLDATQGGLSAPPPMVPQAPPVDAQLDAERAAAVGVQPGSIGGTDAPPPEPEEEETAVEAAQQPAGAPAEGTRDELEETGAAVTPSGAAPEGEYQAEEEVATPDAPAQAAPPPRMED